MDNTILWTSGRSWNHCKTWFCKKVPFVSEGHPESATKDPRVVIPSVDDPFFVGPCMSALQTWVDSSESKVSRKCDADSSENAGANENPSCGSASCKHTLRPFNPPRGVLGPFVPKIGNGVENEFPGPSGPGAQELKTESQKSQKVEISTPFQLFLTLFLTFGTPGPEGPGNSFSTPFPILGPKVEIGGIPAVLSRKNSGKALRAFPGCFRNFSGISSGKVPAVLGVWPSNFWIMPWGYLWNQRKPDFRICYAAEFFG